jgi:hypothetical protein
VPASIATYQKGSSARKSEPVLPRSFTLHRDYDSPLGCEDATEVEKRYRQNNVHPSTLHGHQTERQISPNAVVNRDTTSISSSQESLKKAEEWRRPGKTFRNRIIAEDEKKEGGLANLSISRVKPASIIRYYDVANQVRFERARLGLIFCTALLNNHSLLLLLTLPIITLMQVLDQFVNHPIANRAELEKAYLLGTRLVKFLSNVLPTHPDYMLGATALERDQSHEQLLQLIQFLDQMARIIDEQEHSAYISRVLEQHQRKTPFQESTWSQEKAGSYGTDLTPKPAPKKDPSAWMAHSFEEEDRRLSPPVHRNPASAMEYTERSSRESLPSYTEHQMQRPSHRKDSSFGTTATMSLSRSSVDANSAIDPTDWPVPDFRQHSPPPRNQPRHALERATDGSCPAQGYLCKRRPGMRALVDEGDPKPSPSRGRTSGRHKQEVAKDGWPAWDIPNVEQRPKGILHKSNEKSSYRSAQMLHTRQHWNGSSIESQNVPTSIHLVDFTHVRDETRGTTKNIPQMGNKNDQVSTAQRLQQQERTLMAKQHERFFESIPRTSQMGDYADFVDWMDSKQRPGKSLQSKKSGKEQGSLANESLQFAYMNDYDKGEATMGLSKRERVFQPFRNCVKFLLEP